MAPDTGHADYDAVVIGAGPAGGAAALMLARAGWSVALVEKRPFPRRKLCGEYVSAPTFAVLRELGLGDAVTRLAGPEVRRGALFAREGELVFAMPRLAGAQDGAWGRAIAREQLDLSLLESAASAGAVLWQPWSAAALERRGPVWICHLSRRTGKTALSAPIVIAASGSWERGPVPVRSGGDHRAGDLLAFKGRFVDSDLPPDLMPLIVFPGGYGGMVHGGGGVNLSCCIRRDRLAAARKRGAASAGDAVLRHISANNAAVARVMRRVRLQGSWLAAGPINPGVRKLSDDGLFLAGNLAGEAHPIVAEGVSMAIQSAWLLCHLLIARQEDVAAGRGLAEVGSAYDAAWRRCFSGRLHAAALFARAAMSPRAVNTLLPLLGTFPGLLALGAAASGKRKQARTPIDLARSAP